MKKNFRWIAALIAVFSLALGGCASVRKGPAPDAAYDLGTLSGKQPVTSSLNLPPLSVAQASAPAWLDSTRMFYRLAYENDQQPRLYSNSRWNTPPAQLFEQRLKTRLGQAGGQVLSASYGAMRLPLLYLEIDEFNQVFENPTQSSAHVTVRAAVLQNRILTDQKTFMKKVPAPTPDATGGVEALAQASDAVIADIMTWLAQLPLKR